MEANETTIERLSGECPTLNERDLVQVLSERYGLNVTEFTNLRSYYDRIFHVKVDGHHSNPYIDDVTVSSGYVLRVHNINASSCTDHLDARVSMARHLIKRGINCPQLVKTLDGADFSNLLLYDHEGTPGNHKVSVHTFLPGVTLTESDVTPEFLREMGVLAAEVTIALKDFYHPCLDTFDHKWTMSTFPQVGNILYCVKDEKCHKMCEEVLQAFESVVLPRVPAFQKGTIHGDLSYDNIVINEKTAITEPSKLCGVIDFEDCTSSYTVYEIAICIAYMMMLENPEVQCLDTPGHILAGYTSLLSLNDAERESLRVCVAARIVQSCVYGQYTHSLHPTNMYLIEKSAEAWKALEELWGSPEEDFEIRWRKIIQSYRINNK